MQAMDVDDCTPSPQDDYRLKAINKLNHILKTAGFHNRLDHAQTELLVALKLLNPDTEDISCCGPPNAIHKTRCACRLEKEQIVSGWAQISRIAENLTLDHEGSGRMLYTITQNSMCTHKHKNDDKERKKLHHEWLPIIFQAQEQAKFRVSQPSLAREESLTAEANQEKERNLAEIRQLRKQGRQILEVATASLLEAPAQLPENVTAEMAWQMIVELANRTGMTFKYSKECLECNAWSFEAAMGNFENIKHGVPHEVLIKSEF